MAERLTPAARVAALRLPDAPVVADGAGPADVVAALAAGQFRELWKYTPADAFVEGLDSVPVTCPILEGSDQDGVTVRRLSDDRGRLPADTRDPGSSGRFPLADLALLIAGDALLIDVQRSVSRPLEIRYLDGLSLPVVLRVDAGVHLDLIERADQVDFGNQSLYLKLADDSAVTHASIASRADACHWSLTQVAQSARSRYVRQQYATGGRRRRLETQILLLAADAFTEVTGAYVVSDGSHLDQQMVVEHRAPATASRQRFHGIGAGKGSAVFNGRIHIHPGAPGADATLSNRNLALHPDAVINTKPELEIYTDDVKCSHGATVGRLSDESLFYLRSRGLAPQEARRMLCRAFIRECLAGALADAAEAALLGDWLEATG